MTGIEGGIVIKEISIHSENGNRPPTPLNKFTLQLAKKKKHGVYLNTVRNYNEFLKKKNNKIICLFDVWLHQPNKLFQNAKIFINSKTCVKVKELLLVDRNLRVTSPHYKQENLSNMSAICSHCA